MMGTESGTFFYKGTYHPSFWSYTLDGPLWLQTRKAIASKMQTHRKGWLAVKRGLNGLHGLTAVAGTHIPKKGQNSASPRGCNAGASVKHTHSQGKQKLERRRSSPLVLTRRLRGPTPWPSCTCTPMFLVLSPCMQGEGTGSRMGCGHKHAEVSRGRETHRHGNRMKEWEWQPGSGSKGHKSRIAQRYKNWGEKKIKVWAPGSVC